MANILIEEANDANMQSRLRGHCKRQLDSLSQYYSSSLLKEFKQDLIVSREFLNNAFINEIFKQVKVNSLMEE